MRLKATAVLSVTIAIVLCLGRMAAAEVAFTKVDGWELYTSGRVGVFLGTSFGDANPVPPPGVSESIVTGGGLLIEQDTMTTPPNVQGKFLNMRLRSGFVPNVFAIGLRRQITEYTTLTAHMSLWATIDSEGQRKTQPLFAWVQEWYVKLEGPWGSVLGGRALDLFSRGATQNDYMYLHGYGLGFPGNVEAVPNVSATGLIGFGVMAAFYSPGIAYATPSRFPLQNTIGIYDPTTLPGGWEGTRYPRLEDELTFDMAMRGVRVHLFANGEYQLVYRGNDNQHATSYGVGYGGRAEFGNLHLGVAGHYGKGLGLFFALEPDDVSVNATSFNLRTFDGYSAVAQYVLGQFDINAGWGISRVFLLNEDNYNPSDPSHGTPSNVSVLKYQMAFAGALVFHANRYLHFDIDYLRAQARWFGAPILLPNPVTGGLNGYQPEQQNVNFVNAGMTVTW